GGPCLVIGSPWQGEASPWSASRMFVMCAIALAAIALLGALPAAEDLCGTFSIVAGDSATGEVGVAIQSHYFAVGNVVPWTRADINAIATQATDMASYGPHILKLLTAK